MQVVAAAGPTAVAVDSEAVVRRLFSVYMMASPDNDVVAAKLQSMISRLEAVHAGEQRTLTALEALLLRLHTQYRPRRQKQASSRL